MIVLSGAALVLPDRILSPGTLVIDGDRIVEIRADAPSSGHAHPLFAFHGHYIVPGFIDVHVHGVEGIDALDAAAAGGSIAAIAERLPKYGVTAFCPTTVACGPEALRGVLDQVRRAREAPAPRAARVLPAHLESNFINPEYRGAQPLSCLRSPNRIRQGYGGPPKPSAEAEGSRSSAVERTAAVEREAAMDREAPAERSDFDAIAIVAEIERAAPDVGIVTLAPELEGALDLIRSLTSSGHRVSLGHSGATYDEAVAAIAAGARHATHLFNRMPPINHRRPGPRGGCRRRGAGREFCGRADLHRGPVGVQPSGGDDGAPLRVDAGLSRPEPAIGGRRLTTGMEGSLMRAAIFLALLSLFPAGCVDIVGADIQQVVREQKHFSTTGKPEVVLSTFDGSIEIRPWDNPDAQASVAKPAPDEAANSSPYRPG